MDLEILPYRQQINAITPNAELVAALVGFSTKSEGLHPQPRNRQFQMVVARYVRRNRLDSGSESEPAQTYCGS